MSVFDWAGQVTGHGTASVPLECCTVEQSPDGSRVEVATSDGSVVLNRFGQRVESLPASLSGGTWAGDDVHKCLVAQGNLYLVGPGATSRRVHGVGVPTDTHGPTSVIDCDFSANFALLVSSLLGGVQSAMEIRLSDGAIIWQETGDLAAAGSNAPQAISPAATYAACGDQSGGAVADIATGAQVAQLQGEPLAISWNGHVVIEAILSPPDTYYAEAVDWQTGAVLWRGQPATGDPAVVPTVTAQDQPNGDAIAFTTGAYRESGESADPAQLWLIRPGYPAQELSDDAEPGVL
ncbi:MAG: hypothetical protein WB802_01905 [Candidatus Dormiibacterota bacterium]